jgi:putative endonuclease
MASRADARISEARDRRERGAAVEVAARRHLLAAGLRDIARNASCRLGELDLVMRDGGCVVFVEVRYRRDAGFGGGAASVDAWKRRKLVRAAQVFLKRMPSLSHLPCRFDVVDASGDPAAPDLRWIRAAFRVDEC